METRSIGHSLFVPAQNWKEGADEIFTPPLIELISRMHRNFAPRRKKLLADRKIYQENYDRGVFPSYPPTDSKAAHSQWKVAPIPKDLLCRRVEITGPVHSAKMVINMLSKNEEGIRADTAMLDFEDSMKPSWENVYSGIKNVIGAAEGNLTYFQKGPEGKSGKIYQLDPANMAGLMVRCRGLHLDENNFLLDNLVPLPAGAFDLAVCVFHTATKLLAKGKTPLYYIPKCEHYLEARWWNDLLNFLEESLLLPNGTIKTTFLIETLPAAFMIEEILYEIKDRAVALNVGRWDKIFSDIKVLKNHHQKILPDRSKITMKKYWMDNYAKRLIKICHTHGALAIGGMAAFTPGKTFSIREKQTQKVLEDKQYESHIGHDGCWVSHPYFITTALKAFPQINQLSQTLDDFPKYPDLIPEDTSSPPTLEGLRTNIRVGIYYIEGWNRGEGCIAVDGLMEDLATLEISRAQTWQWLHHKVALDDGTLVNPQLIKNIFDEELVKIIIEIQESFKESNIEPKDTLKIKKFTSLFEKAAEEAEELYLRTELEPFMNIKN